MKYMSIAEAYTHAKETRKEVLGFGKPRDRFAPGAALGVHNRDLGVSRM